MALPPGFLDELRSRTSLSQVVGRKVMWDQRKSNQAKGDMWAPCPFHQEKSASFHVDDRKGFYYCFGCHAKGDIISFVRETENVEFMEAIEILAREAGMTMPARDPRAREKADRRTQLVDVMEAAVRHYRMMLGTQAAGAARDYLTRRGLDAAAIERFEIGFAPDTRQGAFQALTGKGIEAGQVVEAGICARPDDGGAPYDRFRGRIMFPIRDARGRAIAFGGRAMDPNARAKYLNSPETPLFDKGHTLYNHAPAREAAGKGATLILAEGYMDVIALSEAGFGGAVAPLGTAVTPDQLNLLWRIAPEPVVCLDGDTAGLRAAYRVIDLALPMLEAGRSLRFALLPEGKDPDDLIRSDGAGAMQAVLDSALPLVDLLWRQETEGKTFDSPERRAALDKALADRTGTIRDPGLKRHYDDALKDLKWQLFRQRRSPARRAFVKGQPPILPSLATTRASRLVTAGDGAEDHLREAVILAALISTPAVLPEFESELERLDCRDQLHRTVLAAVLAHAGEGAEDLRAEISGTVGAEALEQLMSDPHVALIPPVRRPGDEEAARLCLAEELAKLRAARGLADEVAEAEEELQGVADEAVTWRLGQAVEARNSAGRGFGEDRAEYDRGDNGARINRAEREALDSLLGAIRFSKPRK
ncbi:DNA primase [Oceanicola sp. 22II-s10i]|uniref:DNA primase n=1 Tax=Oceanicola sp. 22II-s10i TaxID=1317116 RepID=UPI000B51FE7C|nr:DNA primase [Oceanicola sp. 22II-s10i]OWU84426.1 DNA primase [Oceanicola sp. 22II-s10i]